MLAVIVWYTLVYQIDVGGFVVWETSCCGIWPWKPVSVVLQLYQIDVGFYGFRHQLLWCYSCIGLMLGFMALDISYCGVTVVSD